LHRRCARLRRDFQRFLVAALPGNAPLRRLTSRLLLKAWRRRRFVLRDLRTRESAECQSGEGDDECEPFEIHRIVPIVVTAGISG
jgi:hypothetical protein